MRKFLTILLAVLILSPVPLLYSQDYPPVVDLALTDLNTRLGTSLTIADLDGYTWAETDFSDASLGCPQQGMAYAQVITRGYMITFTYEGSTYDYRTTPDGSQIILCSTSPASAAPPSEGDPLAVAGPITVENAAQVIELAQLDSGVGTAAVARWSPDGTLIAAAAGDEEGGVWLYPANSPGAASERLMPGEPVTALDFATGDGMTFLAAGGLRGDARFFQVVPEGQDVIVIDALSEQAINAIAISPDRLVVVTATGSQAAGSSINAFHLWNARTGGLFDSLESDSPITALAFSPTPLDDGRWLLAVGRQDGIVQLYGLRVTATEEEIAVEAAEITRLFGHTDAIRALAFNLNGTQLASGSMDTTARLWNTDPQLDSLGAELAVLASGTSDAVLAVAFSPDGQMVATAGGNPNAATSNNAIRLWNIQVPLNATIVATLSGHSGAVGSIGFAPDGRFLLSAADDGTLRLWGVPLAAG